MSQNTICKVLSVTFQVLFKVFLNQRSTSKCPVVMTDTFYADKHYIDKINQRV